MTSSPRVGLTDVLIVGGSATGLSAALALGRSRRRVVVLDDGHPRNASSPQMHGVLGHDGLSPAEFLDQGRRDLAPYDVTLVEGRAASARVLDDVGVQVTLDDGRTYRARALLTATGLRDELPDIPGLRQRWGIDVLHCPYCHGWEVRDQPIAVLGTSPMSVHSALMFRQLSADTTLVLHSGARPGSEDIAKLEARGVAILEGPVTEIIVDDDHLTGLRLSEGTSLAVRAVVVTPRANASSAVLDSLGLQPTPHPMGPEIGTVYAVEPGGRTSLPGVWAAGNVVDPMGAVAKSVADGYFTGAMINADLVMQDAVTAVASHQYAGDHQCAGDHHGAGDHHCAGDHRPAHDGYADRPDEMPVMDQAFWDNRYSSADTVWSGRPNPYLVSEIGALAVLPPGRALDVGAGEGADAIWLAQRGWRVDAVDISPVALARGRERAACVAPDVAERITWTHADLLTHPLEASAYQVVSMQFMQLPPADWAPLFRRCIDAVARGGILLVVAHDPADMEAQGVSPSFRTMFYTAEQVAEPLDAAWTVDVQEVREREVTNPAGNVMTLRDTVVMARRARIEVGG